MSRNLRPDVLSWGKTRVVALGSQVLPLGGFSPPDRDEKLARGRYRKRTQGKRGVEKILSNVLPRAISMSDYVKMCERAEKRNLGT